MIFWPCGAFWQFLRRLKTCAGETNARHSSMHVSNHRFQWTPRNCLNKLVAAIWTQTVTKSSEKWRLFTGKSWLKIYSLWVLGHIWTGFFKLVKFISTLSTYYTFLRQKSLFDFSLLFHPFSPPGRLPKAAMPPWKWFLRVPWWNTFQWDPREPPKPFLEKKYFRPEIPNPLSQPSVQ